MKNLILFLSVVFIAVSCGVSHEVSNGSFVQKRKYTKGYYFASKSKTNNQRGDKSHDESYEEHATVVEDSYTNSDEYLETLVSEVDYNENITTENLEGLSDKALSGTTINSTQSDYFANSFSKQTIKEGSFERVRFNVGEGQRAFYSTAESGDTSADDDVLLIVGLVLCLVALSPLGVFIVQGKGKPFSINLLLWILALVLLIAMPYIIVGWGFWHLGGLIMLLAVVHGILVILDLI